MVLAVLCAVLSAQAPEFYSWVDSSGSTHYTDDASRVPKGARVRTTSGEALSSVIGNVTARRDPALERPAPVEVARTLPLDEEYWRGRFRLAHAAVRKAEDDLRADERRLGDLQTRPIWGGMQCVDHATQWPSGYNGVNSTTTPRVVNGQVIGWQTCWYDGTVNEMDRTQQRIEQHRAALARARDDLHDLERLASNKAVPREWRQ